MKQKSPLRVLLVFLVGLVVLAVPLYFVNPLAPVFLAASVLIQLPFIFLISRASFASSYADRVYERKQRFEKDGDAAAWLAQEEAETKGIGFQYWSKKSRNRNRFLRAALNETLGNKDDWPPLLTGVDPRKLPLAEEKETFERLAAKAEELKNKTRDTRDA